MLCTIPQVEPVAQLAPDESSALALFERHAARLAGVAPSLNAPATEAAAAYRRALGSADTEVWTAFVRLVAVLEREAAFFEDIGVLRASERADYAFVARIVRENADLLPAARVVAV